MDWVFSRQEKGRNKQKRIDEWIRNDSYKSGYSSSIGGVTMFHKQPPQKNQAESELCHKPQQNGCPKGNLISQFSQGSKDMWTRSECPPMFFQWTSHDPGCQELAVSHWMSSKPASEWVTAPLSCLVHADAAQYLSVKNITSNGFLFGLLLATNPLESSIHQWKSPATTSCLGDMRIQDSYNQHWGQAPEPKVNRPNGIVAYFHVVHANGSDISNLWPIETDSI